MHYIPLYITLYYKGEYMATFGTCTNINTYYMANIKRIFCLYRMPFHLLHSSHFWSPTPSAFSPIALNRPAIDQPTGNRYKKRAYPRGADPIKLLFYFHLYYIQNPKCIIAILLKIFLVIS